jgi:DNA polymerase elongation subunit (family B)
MALKLHILDIIARDQKILTEDEHTRQVEFMEPNSSDDETTGFKKKKFKKGRNSSDNMEMLIHIFGSRADGKAVRLDINGFKPYFYIRLPSTKKAALHAIRNYILVNLGTSLEGKIEYDIVEREILFEYTANTKFPFLKITFPSIACFRTVKNLFLDSETQTPRLAETHSSKVRRSEAIRKRISYIPEYQVLEEPFTCPPDVYEANLDPMLRFLHIQNIAPCGWIECTTLDNTDLEEDKDGTLTGACLWNEVEPCAEAPRPTAPFQIASWDIECFSESGDFPIPAKRYEHVIKPLLEKASDPADFGTLFVEALFGSGKRSIKLTSNLLEQLERSKGYVSSYVLSNDFTKNVKAYLDGRLVMKVEEKQNHINDLGAKLNNTFGKYAYPSGDPVIQIGIVFRQLGSDVSERHIFVLGTCDPIEDVTVHSYKDEAAMIRGWCHYIAERNPDILTGYNVFGFDERYLWDRAKELGLVVGEGFKTEAIPEILNLSRLNEFGGAVRLEEKFLSSSALGDNLMYIISMQGRLQIDLYNYVKRGFNLPSYKLDEVTKNFLSGKHKAISQEPRTGSSNRKMRLNIGKKSVNEVGLGRSVVLLDSLGESLTDKMVVVALDGDELILDASCLDRDDAIGFDKEDVVRWVIVKDDVSPQELFKLHLGTAADRAKVGKYCVQDCELVLDLFKKLDVFNNAMSMANVCSVPVNYIFSRGQGIKCESLIFNFCNKKNQAIMVLPAPKNSGSSSRWAKKDEDFLIGPKEEGEQQDDSYEGAIVLEPKADFYNESPVGVCDFASLYPSTIISENISHDSLVWIRDYNDNGSIKEQVFGGDKYDMLPGISYTDIEFDLLRPDPSDTHKNPVKIKVGTRVCRYAQGVMGTIPEILQGLLAKRKATRELIKKETDPFRIALLDAEQNAYKITANSLYGQLGSGTFKVRLQSLAASVTAYGRKQILFAKAAIEKFYGPEAKDPRCSAEIVYGDTDSLFVAFNPRDPLTGARLEGRAAVEATIHITEEAGKFVSRALKSPHDFEFDKVYWPFMIFSKKRYIGNKYEEDADHFSQAFMGVALKRRDYAQIVKTIYGGAIKILLNQRENPVPTAVEFVRRCAMDLVEGRYGMGQLIISKSLKANYANPLSIAHKVLADRIAARDPGNAPAVGERIAFVYVATGAGKVAPKLQGERIETPAYIKAHNLSPDYQFYIDNQIANPICQMFGLLVDKFPEMKGQQVPTDPVDRETLAYKLLFGSAIGKCNAGKKVGFFRLLGAPVPVINSEKLERKNVEQSIALTTKPKVQQKLDTFFIDMAIVNKAKERKKKEQSEKKNGADGVKKGEPTATAAEGT